MFTCWPTETGPGVNIVKVFPLVWLANPEKLFSNAFMICAAELEHVKFLENVLVTGTPVPTPVEPPPPPPVGGGELPAQI
jgi:hypothetical protein